MRCDDKKQNEKDLFSCLPDGAEMNDIEPDILFKTRDHPEANGRKPQNGETEYIMKFMLEDGRILGVRMGQAGFEIQSQLLLDMLSERPSYSDGSMDKRPE